MRGTVGTYDVKLMNVQLDIEVQSKGMKRQHVGYMQSSGNTNHIPKHQNPQVLGDVGHDRHRKTFQGELGGSLG